MNYTTTAVYGTYYMPYPEAFITKGKNRLRQNGSTIYLSNNDEFEIELYNPRSTNVLAKIKINGNYISTRGIVIKPGQRIYLDRFIDDSKRFKFSTYNVDGTDSGAVAAIAMNGDVQVEFYDETIISSFTLNYPIISTYVSNTVVSDNLHFNGSLTANGDPLYSYSLTSSSNYNNNQHLNTSSSGLRSKSIETGRLEKGSNSNTKLQNVDMNFNSYQFHSINWKILPQSHEPVQASDIKNYCSGCGYRIRKNTWTFCPKCGNNL